MLALATFVQNSSSPTYVSIKNYLLLGGIVAGVWLLAALLRHLGRSSQHRRELRARRLELLAESLRDPSLDAATRNDALRALANEPLDAFGWLWQQLRKPMLWKVLWFGTGWMTMLLCGAAIAFGAMGVFRIDPWDKPAITMSAIVGFGMVTLPLALRELLRRERAPASS